MGMTTKEAIEAIKCNWPDSRYTILREALDMAISALRHQGQERNAPLTLDELREMDGEPVWIVEEPDWGHWELSADADDYVADREPSFYGMKHNDPAGRYGLHKLGWLAYRQKPEEGTV